MKLINKILFAFLVFVSTGTIEIIAQNDSIIGHSGLNIEEEIELYKSIPKIPESFGTKSDELPFSISLKAFCPQAVNQGVLPTSVGWSVGYGAMTILHAQGADWPIHQITEKAFSAMFIYNHIYRDHCEGGATLADAGAFLKGFGNYKSKDFDYPQTDCNKTPNETQIAFAKKNKIKDYFKVFSFDEKGTKKTYLTKRSLANKTPVVIGMRIRENFKALNENSKYWNPLRGDTTLLKKGQALVVIGYDDKKRAFQVLNSWGLEWGNDGFAWIKYKDFEKYCLFAYQYIIEENISMIERQTMNNVLSDSSQFNHVSMTGAFSLRYPSFSEEEKITFKLEEAKYKSNYFYEIKKKDWGIGDRFQLIADKMRQGQYLYVFSVDALGVNEHWPRPDETAIIPYKKIDVIIPNEETVFTRRVEGKDNICILYSNTIITDYQNRLKILSNIEGSFIRKFQEAFGDLLIPENKIQYDLNNMVFSIDMITDGEVVPIFITIEKK